MRNLLPGGGGSFTLGHETRVLESGHYETYAESVKDFCCAILLHSYPIINMYDIASLYRLYERGWFAVDIVHERTLLSLVHDCDNTRNMLTVLVQHLALTILNQSTYSCEVNHDQTFVHQIFTSSLSLSLSLPYMAQNWWFSIIHGFNSHSHMQHLPTDSQLPNQNFFPYNCTTYIEKNLRCFAEPNWQNLFATNISSNIMVSGWPGSSSAWTWSLTAFMEEDSNNFSNSAASVCMSE